MMATRAWPVNRGRAKAAVGVTTRHLERLFADAVGLTPKVACRIGRFRSALRMLRRTPSIPWSRLAYAAGYHDRPHLIREFKAFAGLRPEALRAERAGVASVKTRVRRPANLTLRRPPAPGAMNPAPRRRGAGPRVHTPPPPGDPGRTIHCDRRRSRMAMRSRMKKLTPVLYVEEIEPALDFWERLGFTRTTEVPEGDRLGFIILEKDGVEVMYQTRASVQHDVPALAGTPMGGTLLFLEVSDLDEVARALEGIQPVVPRRKTFYGADELIVREPAGNVVTFAHFAK